MPNKQDQEKYPLITTISGIRGIAGKSLNTVSVSKYITAFSSLIKTRLHDPTRNLIIIGRDSRVSGAEFTELATKIILDQGFDAYSVGIVPTPTVQQQVLLHKAAGGIILTASHNPGQWNGIKFVGPSSLFLDAQECAELFKLADSPLTLPAASPGSLTVHTAIHEHVRSVLALPYINHDRIREWKPRVCFDAINGAGGAALRQLLEDMGAEVVSPLNEAPTGIFTRMPEPIPAHLGEFSDHMTRLSPAVDIGLVMDPDADRLVLVDSSGEPLGEELTLAIAVDHVLRDNMKQWLPHRKECEEILVVKNLSSSQLTDRVCAAYNSERPATAPPARCHASAVGEINVGKAMERLDALLGGEGNGGVMVPECHIGRDSLVGTALVLSWMAARGCDSGSVSVREAVESRFEKFTIVKRKFAITPTISEQFKDMAERHVALGDQVSLLDGLHIYRPAECWWVHVRKSNTEPVVRVIGEAPLTDQAEGVVERFARELGLM
eukprot:gnl/Dysnectes_brevis/1063_a1184_2536.p1 GENE.gnl/Dysnectes_brevis/1063_a1184_2536~~gnl/Dysnectes_brevis/1063_a1184_2536.p1  ORF type:complete len:508 (+),score=137.39 gnl/Dysnectes_brevis/1063_a1184_2536:40-1524(+)